MVIDCDPPLPPLQVVTVHAADGAVTHTLREGDWVSGWPVEGGGDLEGGIPEPRNVTSLPVDIDDILQVQEFPWGVGHYKPLSGLVTTLSECSCAVPHKNIPCSRDLGTEGAPGGCLLHSLVVILPGPITTRDSCIHIQIRPHPLNGGRGAGVGGWYTWLLNSPAPLPPHLRAALFLFPLPPFAPPLGEEW